MLWQDVHLFVCHMLVFCLNGYTYPQSFPPLGSTTILVLFRTKRDGNTLMGTLLMKALNARGYEENSNFLPISCFISEMMQDRAIVTMEGEYV